MKIHRHCFLGAALPAMLGFLLSTAPRLLSSDAPLVPDKPMLIPDCKGSFDFLEVDAARRRLLASHKGNGTLDVFDLDSGKLIKHVPTGEAQGVTLDPASGKYFVGACKEHSLVVIDAKTLTKSGEVELPGEADAICFDPQNHCVYVGHDNAPEIWVVEIKQQAKIVATVKISGETEVLQYDPTTALIYQNEKTNDKVAVIDPATNIMKKEWSTAPAKSPHGLIVDEKTHRVFSAGANGKLAVLSTVDGKLIGTVDIASGVDQIAFDATKQRIYCASRTGVISVVQETADGAVSLGDVKTAPGAKTLAVDPKTHAVWVAYGDKEHSYTLRLTAP